MKGIDDLLAFDKVSIATFDKRSITICEKISSDLLKCNEPQLVALGYFFRRGKIEHIRQNYCENRVDFLRMPLGTVLHYAPSNVSTMFAYPWMLSMLCGNSNIVRLSKNVDDKQQMVLDIIEKHLGELEHKNVFLNASHDVNDLLAKYADLRVIWGGDETVNVIRRSALKAAARDLVFPHRYSIAMVTLSKIDEKSHKRLVADVSAFDQAACTSPRAFIMFNSDSTQDTNVLESATSVTIPQDSSHLRLQWVQCAQAKFDCDITLNNVDSPIFVVTLHDTSETSRAMFKYLMDTHPAHNSVIKFVTTSDNASVSELFDDRLQTIVDCNHPFVDDVINFALLARPLRVVRPGDSMKFDHVWDGRCLIEEFTIKMRIS